MNNVLLIGNKIFTSSVVTQVRGLNALTVTIVATAAEASQTLEELAPDVVIAQASHLVEGSVVKTFSQDRHSIYFLVIEEASLSEKDDVRSAHDSETVSPFATRYLEKTASAIESGADAYLWLPADSTPPAVATLEGKNLAIQPDYDTAGQSTSIYFHRSQCRLIQAHIQMGLNRAQRYRDLSRINDWLSAVALVDALTQLSNRRAFDLELPRQIKVARSKGHPLSIMVVDIDFFKSVNDRYGHLVGDDVLKLLAKRLLSNMRFYDAPFRYGGEEFVVTLNNTDLKEAITTAQRLRHSIAQSPFDLEHLPKGEDELSLTVSIGVAELQPNDDEQGRRFLHRADQCLLKAKATGRNRVEACGE